MCKPHMTGERGNSVVLEGPGTGHKETALTKGAQHRRTETATQRPRNAPARHAPRAPRVKEVWSDGAWPRARGCRHNTASVPCEALATQWPWATAFSDTPLAPCEGYWRRARTAHRALPRRVHPERPEFYLRKLPRGRANAAAANIARMPLLPRGNPCTARALRLRRPPTNMAQSRAQYNWHPLHNLGDGPWPVVALRGPK